MPLKRTVIFFLIAFGSFINLPTYSAVFLAKPLAAPVFNSSPVTAGTQDQLYTYNINVTDGDGDAIVLSAPTLPTWLMLTDNGNGSGQITGTPTNNDVGMNSVVIEATAGGETVPQSFTITVANVNDPPILNFIGNKVAQEFTALNFTVTANDIDNPPDILTYTLDATSISRGMSINASTGEFSWTPGESHGGNVYGVTVNVTDNGSPNLNDSENFNISVSETNESPVINAIANQSINETETLNLTVTATDSDTPANTLSYSLDGVSTGLGMSINASTGAFTWTPAENVGGGVYTVTVTATDNGSPSLGDNTSFDITVTDTNAAPVLDPIGNRSVNEQVALNFGVTATDSDDPVNTLSYTLDATSISNGMIINSTTGAFSWTPAESQGGSVFSVTITVTDNGAPAMNDFETFNITVNDINVSPVLGFIGNKTVDENNNLSFTATSTDSDIPVNTLSYSLDATSISRGMTINSTTGAFSWTPTELHGGNSYNVTVTVTDNGSPNLNDQETFNITVNEINTAPVLDPITNKTVNEEVLLSFAVTSVDVDIPANTLTYSLDATSLSNGMAINSGSGQFTWTPSESQGGMVYNVSVTITDNGSPNLSDTESFTITVAEVNKAPLLGAIGNKSVDEEANISFSAIGTDTDLPPNTLTYSLDATALSNGMSINSTTGTFSWTPTESQGGSVYNVTVTVTDNGSPNLNDMESFTITVNDVNKAPVLSSVGNKSIDEKSTLNFTAFGTDADVPANTLAYSLDATAISNGMTINSTTGAFSWTPTESQGGTVYNATITVTDNGTPTLNDQETIQITVNEVNEAPVLSSISDQTVDEFSLLSFTASASDSDIPANGLSYSLDATSLSNGMSINPGSGLFSWTPGESNGGNVYSVTVTVTDNGSPSLSDSEIFDITVGEINAAPVIDMVSDQSVDETKTLNLTVTATDTDTPANSLSFSLDGASTGLGMTINPGTGAFSWTPPENLGGGVYSVTVTVTDDGSPILSDNTSFDITVQDTNVPPVLNAIGNKVINELNLLNFTAVAADSDIPSNNLTFTLGAGAPVGASISAAGVFNWTPSEAQGPGDYAVTVIVTDNGVGTLSDSETVTITVNDVNTPPVLAAISDITQDEGTLISFTASATDTDLPSNTLEYSLVGIVPAGASINPTTGAFTWTPAENQSGTTYSIIVQVSDGEDDDIEIVDITVNEVNEAPVLNPVGDRSMDELSNLTFNVSSVDPDIPANVLSYTIDGAAQTLGMSMTTTGVFSWTPTESQGGSSFNVTITVSDNGTPVLTDQETILITVNDVNSPPVLDFIGNKTGSEDNLISFTVTATDPDQPANALTFSLGGTPPGDATINPTTGLFTWTPVEGDAASSPFNITIIVTDNGSGNLQDSETIAINLNSVNQSPSLDPIANQNINELSTLNLNATASDPDLPADNLTYSLGGSPPAGASINPSTGAFSWTPTETQGGTTYPITIVVTDDGVPNLDDNETFNVTVNDVNLPPVLNTIGNQSVDEESPLIFTAVATDTDIPVNTLTFSIDALSITRGMSMTSDGDFNWTPTEAQGGTSYPVTVTVRDNGTGLLTDQETITISVAEINKAPVLDLIGDKSGDEGTLISFTASANDADSPVNTLSFSLDAGAPTGASINATSGLFNWTPSEVQGPGIYNITVRATDNGSPSLSDFENIEITVSEINTNPVLDPISDKIVNELQALSFSAMASDADLPANNLTFSIDEASEALGITIGSNTGLLNWTPTEAQGPGIYPVTIIVTDNGIGNRNDSETFNILVNEVNQAPQLSPISAKTVDELNALSFTVNVTDNDIPANSLSFSLGPGAPSGATINATTGQFNWTPAENQGGLTYNVAVQVTDGIVDDVEFFSITVNDVNSAPVLASIGNKSVNELQILTFSVSSTDPDVPANNLSYSINAAAQAQGMSITNGGNFSWTPSESQGGGSFSVTITVTDDGTPALNDSETIMITVNDLNSAPELDFIGNRSGDELTQISIIAEATDTDLPGDNLTFSLEGSPPSGASITSGGLFTWTPTEVQGPGIYSITVRVTDDGVGTLSDTETFDITVLDVNSAPVLASIGNKSVAESQPLTFTASGSDSDIPSNTLIYSLTGAVPAGATINSNTGVFNWTPSEAQGGANYTFGVKVSDGSLEDSEIITVTVNDVNLPPVLSAVGNKTINETQTLSFSVSAIDPDIPNNNFTFSIDATAQALGMTMTNGGTFSWTPNESQGGASYFVTITVTDDGTPLLNDQETIQINVTDINSSPVLNFIGSQDIDELVPFSFTATATDPDLPADVLSYSLEGTPPAGASINSTTGVFNWTPSETQGPAVYSITVRVTDNGTGNLFDTETFDITVNDVNSAPVLDFISDKTVNELVLLTFTATANDFDVPENPLTFSLTGGAPAGASINATTGVFNWTPTEAQGGQVYTFTVRVSDGDLVDTQEIDVTVNDVNVPPMLAAVGDKTVNELNTLNFIANATDSDLPSNNLIFSIDITSQARGMSITTGGNFTWTPNENQGGNSYNVTVTVRDNGTPALSDSEVITITVNDINSAPKLDFIGNQTGDELTLITFTATASDSDLPADDLTFSLGGTPPAGAQINSNNGVFTWTPTEAQGAASPFFITIIVTDNGSPNLSDSETFQIFLNSVNVPPVLQSIGNKNVNELETLSFTAAATDSDIPANTLTYSLGGSPPAGATIDPVSGAFSWTTTEENGGNTYPITIVVTDDGDGNLSDSETVQVTVNDINLPPVLNFIPDATINESELSTITITATDPDIPADNLIFSLGGTPPPGAFIDPVSGIFSWTPAETQGGSNYNITIIVADNGTGMLSDSQVFNITVNDVNAPPVLDPIGNKVVNELNTLNFTVTASDPDIPVNTLMYTLTGAPPPGATINSSTGEFNWTPGENQQGTYSFDIQVNDGTLFDVETIEVVVNDVNSPPQLQMIGNKSVNEGALLDFVAVATDSDIPVDQLSFSLGNSPPSGASINASTGRFTWTPAESHGGVDYDITIVVTDNGVGSLSDLEVFTVTVNEVNSPPVLDPIDDILGNEDILIQFTAMASDPDIPANNLSYSLLGSPPLGATIDPTSGIFTWTPSENQSDQTYSITIQVTDNGAGNLTDIETFNINVIGVNTPPVLDPIGNRTGDELTKISFTASASDLDIPIQPLTFSLQGTPPAGASIDPDSGLFEWTPTEAQGGVGPFTVTIQVSDGIQFDSETFEINVNEVNVAPQIQTISVQNIDEQVLFEFTPVVVDPDIPVNDQTFGFGSAVPDGMDLDTDTGKITWTPTETQGPESYVITLRVRDEGGLTHARIMTINVLEVNNPPVLQAIGSKMVDELSLLSFQASATDIDLPANTIEYSLKNAPAGASINPTTGLFNWTPSESQGGANYNITIVADDGKNTDEEVVNVSVADFNESPVLNSIGDQIVDEQVNLSFQASAVDPDLPVNILTFSLDANSLAEGMAITSGGQFSWTPSEIQGGFDYPVTVTVRDNGTPQFSDSETFTISVAEINRPPVLEPIGSQSGKELELITFTAVASDPDSPENNLTFSLGSNPPQGASIHPTTGLFTWTPTQAQGEVGIFTISIIVTDDGDPPLPDSEDVQFLINIVNEPPSFTSTPVTNAVEGINYFYNINTFDPDISDSRTITGEIIPDWLTLNVNNTTGTGSLSGIPGNNDVGDHQVQLKVRDTFGAEDFQDFVINVKNSNVAPVLSTVFKTGQQGVTLNFESDDFINAFEDDDEDEIQIIKIKNLPLNGVLILNDTVFIGQDIPLDSIPKLIYQPDLNFAGEDRFSWNAFDGVLFAQSDADVSISITPTILIQLLIYNTFTPNGDGDNDFWVIDITLDGIINETATLSESFPGSILKIYNINGYEVYNKVDYDNSWDGTSGGKDLPQGSYYYTIDLRNGTEYTGIVHIYR